MKRMRDILSESLLESGEYRYLNDEEIKKVQNKFMEALEDILIISKELNTKLFMVGGSLLGAVRHGGFIPWDDDLDLGIMRKDYIQFISCFEKEFGSKYKVLSPNYKDGSQTFYGRIYINDIIKIVPSNDKLDYPQNLFIDLFIIDYAPKNKVLRTIKGLYIDGLRFIGSSVFRYTYKNKIRHTSYKQNILSGLIYNFRISIGFLFSFINYKKWFNLFDKKSQSKISSYITIPSGRKYYLGEVLNSSVFSNTTYLQFENLTVPCPKNYHDYLVNLYGPNYMDIPDQCKREKHLVKKLEF